MPIVKIHVLEGQYDEPRLSNVSKAVQDALMSVLRIPPDDFFQIIHELPRNRFLHTPSFVGMKYSDDFILLEVTFISGRPKETRLALLKELNARIVDGAGISADDLMVQLVHLGSMCMPIEAGISQISSECLERSKTPTSRPESTPDPSTALPVGVTASPDSGVDRISRMTSPWLGNA